MSENIGAPLLISVNDDLRVRAGAKAMALFLQFGPELLVVVNLAIEDHPDLLVGVRHRLMPPGQIDDGEAAEAQPERSRDEIALIIGTAMRNRTRHAFDRLAINRLVAREIKLAGNAAHRVRGRRTEDGGQRTDGG